MHLRPITPFLLLLSAVTCVALCSPTMGAQFGGVSELLHEESGANFSKLGHSVAIVGDVNNDGFDDFMAGSIAAAPGGLNQAGSAFVYSGATGAVLFQIDGTHLGGMLGGSVAGAGDVNNDGFDDFLIGEPNAMTSGQVSAGSAYVYSGVSGALLYQYDGQFAADEYGASVAGVGDVDQDGFDDFLIGAHGFSLDGVQTFGAAFLFSGATGQLIYDFLGDSLSSGMGYSVAAAGDVDGDGTPDVVVGANLGNRDGVGGLDRPGSAFVFSGASGTILHRFDGSVDFEGFGHRVSGAGDVDADGFDDLIVSGPLGMIANDPESGAVYVYSGRTGALLHLHGGGADGNHLGTDVAGVGDLNGDGFDDYMASAIFGVPDSGNSVGLVTVYSGLTGLPLLRLEGANQAGFGSAIAGGGDLNGNGQPDLVVGAVQGVGFVYTYEFSPVMMSSVHAVSAAAGGNIDFILDFPDTADFYDYRILISAGGVGSFEAGVVIPLTLDSLVRQTVQGNYPFVTYTGLQGTLDVAGDASAQIVVPAGLPASLVGRVFRLAAVAGQAGLLPEFSSVAVPLSIEL